MKTTVLRAAVTLCALASIALAGAGGVRAADPTLGASVQSRVYLSDDSLLRIANRSEIPETFAFAASGGWSVEPTTIVLDPGQESHVVVVGLGEDGGSIEVTVSAAEPPPPGRSPVTVTLGSRVYYERPINWLSIGLTILAALVGVAGLALGLRRAKPWQLRLTRHGS